MALVATSAIAADKNSRRIVIMVSDLFCEQSYKKKLGDAWPKIILYSDIMSHQQ